jgi:hypothetical protein
VSLPRLAQSCCLQPALLALLTACTGGARTVAPAPRDPNDLVLATRRVATLVAAPYDRDQHRATFKIFHHLYAGDGTLLTKGLGGEFEHHRGLFLGWNQLRHGGQQYDFWHGHRGEHQTLSGFTSASNTQSLEIAWRGADGGIVLREERHLSAGWLELFARSPDPSPVLQIDAMLHAVDGAVTLAGDPQHSGQQFRALDRFAAAGGPKVRYLRPPAAKGHDNDVWTDCEWIAAVLPLPTGEVTVLRVELPGNPPATWSTRDYGRFGATWSCTVEPGQPLRLRVAYVVADGAMDAAWCERSSATVRSRAE